MPEDQSYSSENPYEHTEAEWEVPEKAQRVRPLFPPIWVWTLFGIFAALIAYVRGAEVGGDRAIANVLTLILAFFACNVLSVWFLFMSGYTRVFRFNTLAAVLGLVVCFFLAFKIDHVTGELVPVFRPRWMPPRDEQMQEAQATSAVEVVDLTRTTENDFPQFLGPNRNGKLSGPRLKTDWHAEGPTKVWRQPIGAGWSAFAAVNGFAITLEQRSEQELVTCYQIATGELVWVHAERARHETVLGGVGPRSTPTIHAGKVYALGAMGNLLCLAGSTGDVIWQDNLLQRYGVLPEDDGKAVAWGRSGSPLIVDDLVVVPAGGPATGKKVSLAAFDSNTGDLVWEAGDRQVGYSSPVLATLAGKRQIVSVNENNVSGHDAKTGKILWEFDWAGHSNGDANVSNPQILSENRLLFSKHYGKGSAMVKLSQGSDAGMIPAEIWSHEGLLKTKFTNAIVHRGFAYALSDGVLECVDIAKGKRRWKRGRYGQGQILLVGNVILVQAESGEVAMVDASPKKFRELSRFQAIDGQTWNNLCLYGDLLLVRNAEEAACYRLPTEAANDATPAASAPAASPPK